LAAPSFHQDFQGFLVDWYRGGRGRQMLGRLEQGSKAVAAWWSWHARSKANVVGPPPLLALPLHEDAATKALFNSSIHCIVGDNCSTRFWLDPWMDGRSITDRAPDLLAAVHPRCQSSRTVATALDQDAWLCDIVDALMLPSCCNMWRLGNGSKHFGYRPPRRIARSGAGAA
jgi:hypothetical protein